MRTDVMGNAARAVAGPALRRMRREIQWRRCGSDLKLSVIAMEECRYPVAGHTTPLYRELAGVDDRLQHNKVANLAIALERLDGLALLPGQRFSFWWHVRKPTYRRGFLDGLVLSHGRLGAGVGGGLCQLTNLIYWMTLHTPLTVVERWRHSYDVFPDVGRTQPFGSGATCAWPILDLQIENKTDTTFRLGLHLTDAHLLGVWTADKPAASRYEVYEAEHVITHDGPGVFVRRNVVRRRTLDAAGAEVDDELVAANDALLMYQPFLTSPRSEETPCEST